MRTFLVIAMWVLSSTIVLAFSSYKKEYCNNQDFYTNTGADAPKTYPHLHCGKNYITYTEYANSHLNVVDKNQLKKGTASSACFQADKQKAQNLKAIIKRICTDDGVTCEGC